VRLRDEIKRLQTAELAVGDDPLTRQAETDSLGGGYAGERPFGRVANMPARRARKRPTRTWGRTTGAAAGRGRRRAAAGSGGAGGRAGALLQPVIATAAKQPGGVASRGPWARSGDA
jgi:hypothetical protein